MSSLIPLHLLLARGRCAEDLVCHDGQRFVVWCEFAERVGGAVARLKDRSEARWLLAADDPLRFAIGFLALLHAGKQVVIPPNAQPGTLAGLAGVVDAQYVGDDGWACGSEPFEPQALDPQRAIIDLYTSGSTGEAKRVRKTLAQFDAEIAVLETTWGDSITDSTVLATVPHQHIYGLLFRLLWPLAAGRTFDAVTCTHPDTLTARLKQLGRAVLISSPAQLARLPELVTLASLEPRPAMIFSSGGPLAADTAETWLQQLGQAPVEVFGSTETGGVAWRRQGGDACDGRWTPFPGVTVGRDENGALVLNSPYLPDAARHVMDDAVELSVDGRFRLLGRLDRVVKIEEKRLSLPDMEARIHAHPWVRACALVPLAGRRQRLGAVVELNDEGRRQFTTAGKRIFVETLRKYLISYFERVLLPRHWRFPERLPVNERGKIAHSDLVRLFSVSGDAEPVLYPDILAVSREEGASVVVDMQVPACLAHFAGHFPDMPILPGVTQVDWAVRFAKQYLKLDGGFSSLENVKFLALIFPDTRLQLALKWDVQTRRLDFSYANSRRKFSTGRVVFGASA